MTKNKVDEMRQRIVDPLTGRLKVVDSSRLAQVLVEMEERIDTVSQNRATISPEGDYMYLNGNCYTLKLCKYSNEFIEGAEAFKSQSDSYGRGRKEGFLAALEEVRSKLYYNVYKREGVVEVLDHLKKKVEDRALLSYKKCPGCSRENGDHDGECMSQGL